MFPTIQNFETVVGRGIDHQQSLDQRAGNVLNEMIKHDMRFDQIMQRIIKQYLIENKVLVEKREKLKVTICSKLFKEYVSLVRAVFMARYDQSAYCTCEIQQIHVEHAKAQLNKFKEQNPQFKNLSINAPEEWFDALAK